MPVQRPPPGGACTPPTSRRSTLASSSSGIRSDYTSSLVFTLARGSGDGFLSAYADPVGGDGQRVFYFSMEDGSVKLGVSGQGKGVTERLVRLPAAQRPGRYRVYAVLAERALSRDEMLAGAGQPSVAATVTAQVEVIVSP
jgi:hypothetical protein